MDIDIFSHALTAISQGVLISGNDGLIIYFNEAFSEITGYVAEDVIGNTCSFMQGVDTDTATVDAIRAALSAGQGFAAEILNYKKSGAPFWNELDITPIRDERGEIVNFIGTIRDVTARRSAEKALLTLERHYRFLFDHVHAGIVLHGAGTDILYANSMAAELLGINQDRTLSTLSTDPSWGFIREDGSRMPVEEYPVNRAVAVGGLVKNLVLGLFRPNDHKLVWVMANAYPVFGDNHELESVVVSFTDVTELKQTEQALQKSEERLRLVLRGANDAAWDWDLITDESYYSPRWWQMIGYETNEMPADFETWKRLVHPKDRSHARETLERAMSEGLTSYETEFRLHHKEGHYVPVLSRGFILRDDAGKAIRVSGTNTDLTERKRTEKQIHKLAFYDALTGLPNRQMLMELLRSAMDASKRSHQHGALVFIDLDNFKMLNDTRGHDIGDLLLQQVARRLRRCMRGADAVARLGGDEFVIVLENLGVNFKEATRKAEEAAQKIREAMSIPFVLGSTDYRCTVSIGVAPFEDFNHGVDGVFKQADLAMYKAKAAGRNAVRFFDSAMQVAVDEQLALENDLRTGLQAKQLVIYMQPQVNQTGTILGAEVLVRWRHPTRGMVLPAVFIALAEATGLILPLGEWVLRATCRQLALWASHPQLSTLTLSVNVSVRQFHEVDFVDKVLKTLGETGANPAKLKMEMTESLLAENLKDIVAKMSRLRSYGIRLSLDDFGTGYSSLSYLQRMPLNELKIDRAFVRDVLTNPNDAAIARIIISLAANLGLDVIAEGVETEGQRQFLESHGCLNYQGYLFGKPMALADFEASVAALDISSLVSKV